MQQLFFKLKSSYKYNHIFEGQEEGQAEGHYCGNYDLSVIEIPTHG